MSNRILGRHILGRAAGTFILVFGLAACVDADLEIEILSETEAKGTMAVSMDRGLYEMSQAQGSSDFCSEGVVEIDAETATCTAVVEGPFADLRFDNEQAQDADQPEITVVAPGLVRVSFPMGSVAKDMGGAEMDSPEARQMMEAFFAGHAISLTVSGGEIVETNMELAEDGRSAKLVINFMDLINGEAAVPEEAFAVVRK